MKSELLILLIEAIGVYFLVLWTHSLRKRFGLAPFYSLLGGITAVMSWITDAGVTVEVGGIIFVVGSAVFYTSLLLGVFVVYVFDGPRATRIAILTIAGVSVMVPIIALILHFQSRFTGSLVLGYVPIPSIRINIASVLATAADLVFLAVVWEILGKGRFRVGLSRRSFFTLLGVMWLDVILFSSGAYLGTPGYLNIMEGTLLSRFIITLFAYPFLYFYIWWQNKQIGTSIEGRPALSILRKMAEVREELGQAHREIEARKKIEKKNEALIQKLQQALLMVRRLEGLLSVCASCKRIRVETNSPGESEEWVSLENYIHSQTAVKFTHGICRDCMKKLYPE